MNQWKNLFSPVLNLQINEKKLFSWGPNFAKENATRNIRKNFFPWKFVLLFSRGVNKKEINIPYKNNISIFYYVFIQAKLMKAIKYLGGKKIKNQLITNSRLVKLKQLDEKLDKT